MTINHRLFSGVLVTVVFCVAWAMQAAGQSDRSTAGGSATELRPVSSFADIADVRARAVALFIEAGKVFRHPRCANCHPGGDRPLQGEQQRPHRPLVVRGKDNLGAPAMACATCHGSANFDAARVPGTPHWQLAPAIAGFKDKPLRAICQQLKDPKRNGGNNIDAILKHLVTDNLVKWAWNPGLGRTPAPGTHTGFVALMDAWAANQAHCPT